MDAPDYFDALKNDLDITYTDAAADAKLLGICRRAEAYLRKASGNDWLTFHIDMEDQTALQLLFDCCRYMRSNALDDFAKNYGDELWSLRANHHIQTAELEGMFDAAQ